MIRRTVLLVAFHFPPVQGSSGVQRTLRFAQHLPKYGWRPAVLTVDPRAYEKAGVTEGNEIPEGLEVHRARGFDTARQLSWRGRYFRQLAMPDRWATWRYWAVRKALKVVRASRIDVIWSTFPIATAHQIGREVERRLGLPWVAEFRDPMWQGAYPPDSLQNRLWREIESDVFARAARVVVTTPGAVDTYAKRFPRFPPDDLELIPNGYDDETFRRAESSLTADDGRERTGPVTLLHSGVVYHSERDPTHLFAAIARLKSTGWMTADRFRLVLRASGDDAGFARELARLDIADIVRLEPAVDYLFALREMLTVDGLLVLQAANCNAQVPAKIYEYLRAGRPILALTDAAGDTARTLESAGAGLVAQLDSAEDIERALKLFVEQARTGRWRLPTPATVAQFSREAQAGQLARLLDSVMIERHTQGRVARRC
jgi:glycosyltransferase involved in cell wall biosynthesis